MADQPGMVSIRVDERGFSDIGCYGSEIANPNIDRLVAEWDFKRGSGEVPQRYELTRQGYPSGTEGVSDATLGIR